MLDLFKQGWYHKYGVIHIRDEGLVIPLFQIIIRIVVIADASGNSTSPFSIEAEAKLLLNLGTEKSVAPPKDNQQQWKRPSGFIFLSLLSTMHSVCFLEALMTLSPYCLWQQPWYWVPIFSLLLSLLLPNSLLCFLRCSLRKTIYTQYLC